jgi:serine/threonine protein kinase
LDSFLGSGGSSWVYRAQRLPEKEAMEERTGLPARMFPDDAAVKLFNLLGSTAEELRLNKARFLAEAQALKRLTHPNIVNVIDSGDDSGFTYILLRYIPGGDLKSLLMRSGPLPLERADAILTQIAAALDAAHQQGIIHRDVKPGNIFLDEPGNAYLADFGIARIVATTNSMHTAANTRLGTASFMAPEQFARPNSVDIYADIYSLGMVAFTIVCGAPAFEGQTETELMYQHLNTLPASPRDIRADLPEPAAAAILQALAKDPMKRFGSAGAFAQAFTMGLQGRYAPGVTMIGGDANDNEQTIPDAKQPDGEAVVASGGGIAGGSGVIASAAPAGRPFQRRFPLALAIAGLAVALVVLAISIVGLTNVLGEARKLQSGLGAIVSNGPTATSDTAASPTSPGSSSKAHPTATSPGSHPKGPAPTATSPGSSPKSPTPTATRVPTPIPTATPLPQYYETATKYGSPLFTGPDNQSGLQTQRIAGYATVRVSYACNGLATSDGNYYFYRLWNSNLYAPADDFYNNGATSGPSNTIFVDPNVPYTNQRC